jgi:pimeloyl-ACP methyl ester carboxylesterase
VPVVGELLIPAVFGRGELSVPHHRESVAWLASHTPGAELVEIDGAAHGAHLSHPDGFAAFVRRAVHRAVHPEDGRVLEPAVEHTRETP